MTTNETAPEPPALVWIALSVDMPNRIQEEIDVFLANSVSAGGGIVDESEVPAAYRGASPVQR